MSSVPSSSVDLPLFPADRVLLWVAAAFILLPLLLLSTPEYRQVGLLVFGITAILLAPKIPAAREAIWNRYFLGVLLCLLLAHLFSFIGGIRHGEMALPSGLLGIYGIVGVLGVAVLTAVLVQPKWHRVPIAVAIGLAIVLVVSSLLGYLVFIGWQLELSARSVHYDPRRLALVWPTRMLAMPLGQLFWTHTNAAAYLFAAAWVVLLDVLYRRPRFAAAGWILAILLATATFLTASRSAFLMIAAALPFLLAFRSPRFALKTFAVLGLAFGLGFAGLQFKIHRIVPPPPAGESPPLHNVPGAIHVAGIVDRGSAGRLPSYRLLWEDLADARLFGQGFGANRLPIGALLHEHSTYLATLRAGGLFALAAHLALIGISLSAAFALARRGCRWPLLFAVAIFSGLLFDRSSVIHLNGFDEFLTHWLAVWIPIFRLAAPPES